MALARLPRPRTTYLIKRLERLVHRELSAIAGAEELTATQYAALSVLAEHPGLSSAQLSRRAFVTAQSMHELVGALVAGGLIDREPDPENNRVLRASLTEHGAAVLARCDAGVDEVEHLMLQSVSNLDVHGLRVTLQRQIDALEAAAAQDRPPTQLAEPGPVAPTRPTNGQRRDGQRNRERIRAAARELFTQRSFDEVQLDDVAAAAGVSRATLFRHIGSKDALVQEVFQARLEDIAELAERALALGAWEGFELTIASLASWMHEDRGLFEYVRRVAHDPASQTTSSIAMAATLDEVILRAQREGLVWDGLRTIDLIPLLAFAAEPDTHRLDSFVRILLTGLRTGDEHERRTFLDQAREAKKD